MPATAARTAAGLGLAGALVLATSPGAAAQVLVHSTERRACVGDRLTVGVWYQEYSGGPRGFRVVVRGPGGDVLLKRRGAASSEDWRYWRMRLHRAGDFRTRYRVQTDDGPAVVRFRTHVHRC